MGSTTTWDENLLWFEREYGSVWNFGPIPEHDPDEFHNVFQEIAHKLVEEEDSEDVCRKEPTKSSLSGLRVASDESNTSRVSSRLLAMGRTLSGKMARKGNKAKTMGNFPFDEYKDQENRDPATPQMKASKSSGSAVVRALSGKFRRSRAKTDPTCGASAGPSGNFPFEEWRDPNAA
jgi:hypothetical protein